MVSLLVLAKKDEYTSKFFQGIVFFKTLYDFLKLNELTI